MRRHNDAKPQPALIQRLVRTVGKGAADPIFRTVQVLISRHVHARLDDGMIEEPKVFAASDRRERVELRDDCSAPIVTIEAKERALRRNAVSRDRHLDAFLCSAELLASVSIAGMTKAGDPLMGMHVEHGRAGTNDFSSLAPRGARRAEGTHTPPCCEAIRRLWEGPLTSGFSCPIASKDVPAVPLPIPPSGVLLFWGETTCQQIREEEGSQGFDGLSGQCGSKAAKGGGRRQAGASEQSHEGDGTWLHGLVQCFQRSLAAESVAEEHGQKIKNLVASEPPSGKAYSLGDLGKNPLFLKVGCDQGDFAQPGWGCWPLLEREVDLDGSISDTLPVCLLE
jgi:hypothetical protein